MKLTYHACFVHNRVYHPKRLHWIMMGDELPTHLDFHLKATSCDICTKGASHETRTTQEVGERETPPTK